MKYFNSADLNNLEKRYRAHLINSCTGYKSANLIATRSDDGVENVAVFSSVTHLGSNPPLLSFILRPTTVPRNTYDNLKNTGYFTVNHIHAEIISEAHHTSAKYDGTISEFNQTQLKSEYKNEFYAPFVQKAPVQIGCKYIRDYYIEENKCLLIIGAIEQLHCEAQLLHDDGFIQLDRAQTVAVNGLDGYALPKLQERLAYAKPKN